MMNKKLVSNTNKATITELSKSCLAVPLYTANHFILARSSGT
jgi:hypothetical protein